VKVVVDSPERRVRCEGACNEIGCPFPDNADSVAEWVAEINGVGAGVPVEVQATGEPGAIFLGKPTRLRIVRPVPLVRLTASQLGGHPPTSNR
jgi:hypothetical protein